MKLEKEQHSIEERLDDGGFDLSNLEKAIDLSLKYATNLPKVWELGDLEIKRKIQNIVFPEGLLFDFKNDTYRTLRVNTFFGRIPLFSDVLEDKKNGKSSNFESFSRSVPSNTLASNSFFRDIAELVGKRNS